MLQEIKNRVSEGWRLLPQTLVPSQTALLNRQPFLRQSAVDSSPSGGEKDSSTCWSPPAKYKPSVLGKFLRTDQIKRNLIVTHFYSIQGKYDNSHCHL